MDFRQLELSSLPCQNLACLAVLSPVYLFSWSSRAYCDEHFRYVGLRIFSLCLPMKTTRGTSYFPIEMFNKTTISGQELYIPAPVHVSWCCVKVEQVLGKRIHLSLPLYFLKRNEKKIGNSPLKSMFFNKVWRIQRFLSQMLVFNETSIWNLGQLILIPKDQLRPLVWRI